MRMIRSGGIRSTLSTETVTVKRGSTDKMSKRVPESEHEVGGSFWWGAGRSTGRFSHDWDGKESASTSLFFEVARGADVQARDRLIRASGEKYVVVGHALWGEDFPLDDDFDDFIDGTVVFQLGSANG